MQLLMKNLPQTQTQFWEYGLSSSIQQYFENHLYMLTYFSFGQLVRPGPGSFKLLLTPY